MEFNNLNYTINDIELWVKYLVLLSFILSVLTYVAVTLNFQGLGSPSVSNSSRSLFITAHPDDECMFFAPAILHLTRTGHHKVNLLCVTSGNFDGKGSERKNEILESGKILRIPSDCITVLDNSSFPDGNTSWDFVHLRKEILDYMEMVKPDTIFTFDEHGVSGHPNHIAVSEVVKQILEYYKQNKNEDSLSVYKLHTVPLYRKYISILDLPASLTSAQLIFVSSVKDVLLALRAMMCHRSQLVWFRHLYVLFSRYMIMNTFTPVDV